MRTPRRIPNRKSNQNRQLEQKSQQLAFEHLEPKVLLTGTGFSSASLIDNSTYIAEVDTLDAQEKFVRDHLASQDETAYLQQGRSDLRLLDIKYGLAGIYTKFVQTIDGYEVFGANITVNQGPDGTVQTLFDDGFEKLNIGNIPADPVLFKQAESLALENAGGSETFAPTKGNWAWFIDDQGNAVAGWKMTVFGLNPVGDYLTFIDGTSGEILFQENRMAFATGSGNVFEPNPYQTQGSGSGLNDNNDANSAALNAQMQNVTLLGLDDGTGLLTGEFVDLATLNSPTLPDIDANEPSRIYNYTRDDARFEQVVIYHSVDSIQRYFHALGFDDDTGVPNGIRDFPSLANAHWFTQDQSFYSSGNDAIHFGDGGVDDGEDADIVAHEYGHAVQFNQNASWGGGDMGAMGEGFGDYLAVTFYFDDGDSNYQANHAACVGEWDATSYSSSNPPCLRRIDGNKTYNDRGQGVHADGEIWSRALWDIRAAIGAATTDQLVLEHHFALPGGATMPIAAEAMLLADQNLNGGANQTAIRQAFVDREILEPLPDEGSITLDAGTYNTNDTITVTVVDANASAPITVDFVVSSGDVETVTLTDIGGNTFEAMISTTTGSAVSDGQLQVQLGDTVTASYFDADDGTGNSNTVSAQADIANVFKYDATGLPIVIEAGPHLSTIEVTDAGTVADLDVFLNINHTFAADLDVFLIAPDGTRVELFTDVGGGGNDFIDTFLDDEAGTAINSGSAPFTGYYRPEGDLSDFDDLTITGTWTLEINDDYPFDQDSGTLNAWSLCMAVTPDPVPDIDLTATINLTEGDDGSMDNAVFQITLSQAADDVVTIDYATSTAGLTSPATAGVDFTAVSGTATFQPGETTYDVLIPVIGDNFTEDDEQFNLELSNEVGGILLNNTSTATITDNEVISLVRGIDFGTESSPIVAGHMGVTDTAYTAQRGFGWLPSTTNIQTVENLLGTARTKDVAIVEDGRFVADLPSGDYRVTVWIGERDVNYAGLQLTVEGFIDKLPATGGGMLVKTYRTSVTDGQLTLDLDGIDGQTVVPIAALQISDADIYKLDFGPTLEAGVAAGFELGTNELYAPTSGLGWAFKGTTSFGYKSGTEIARDYAEFKDGQFLADIADGTYDVTLTFGHPEIAQTNILFGSNGQFIDSIAVAAGQTETRTYPITVTGNQIDLFFKNDGVQPRIYLNSVEIVRVSSKFSASLKNPDLPDDTFDAGAYSREMNPVEFYSNATNSLSESLLKESLHLESVSHSELIGFDSTEVKSKFTAQPIRDGRRDTAIQPKSEAVEVFDLAIREWELSLEQWT